MARRRSKRAQHETEERAWHTWWDGLPDRTQHVICALLLAVLSFSFFAPLHFSGKELIGGDQVQWRSMAQSIVEHQQATGEEPKWAPNAFAGMPAYMISYTEAVPQIDDVPGQLRKVIWPSSHFIFLLIGTYLLVVLLTRNKLAGVLSAVAYGLTTYLALILVAGHVNKFFALCFAPWLVLAFAYVLRRPRLLGGLLFAIALGANLRAIHPQITYYVCFLLLVWWIVEGVAAYREGELSRFGKATAWLALGGVLGLLLVAQPYLVHFEYKNYTIRGATTGSGAGGMDLGYAMSWSQGIGELVTLLIPGAYGGGQAYWGPKPFTSGPHYVGGIVLALAVLAVLRVRRRAVWGLAIAAFLMTLFALGEHLMWLNSFMFDYFPFFDAFRAPETWLSIVAFALAVLAGAGAYYAARREPTDEGEASKSRSIYLVWGGVVGLVVVLLLGRGAFFDFERPGEREQLAQRMVQQLQSQRPDLDLSDQRVRQAVRQNVEQAVAGYEEQRREMFTDDALRTLLFLLLAGALLVAYHRGVFPAYAAVGVLALLVTIDLWGVDRRYLNEGQLVEAEEVEDQVPEYGFDRFLVEREREAGGPGRFRVLSLESGSPMSNARPAFYHETLGGYHGAKLRLYQDFIDHLFIDDATGMPSETMLDMMNTRYVVARGRLPGTGVVHRDEQTGLVVLRNPDALPRAFFVGQTEVVASAEETFERLQSPSFEPRETALLSGPIDFEPAPIDSGSTARVDLVSYGAEEIVWQVETDAPRLLVASEVYYPAGWEAEIDGEEAPIYRANHLLRAVPVPAGEHTVRMTFRPLMHRLGVWISAVTTVLVYGGAILLLGLGWRRRRQ